MKWRLQLILLSLLRNNSGNVFSQHGLIGSSLLCEIMYPIQISACLWKLLETNWNSMNSVI
ncbi:hypothetical protein HZS_4799 [Henneguya salminicola]|nr:hypothetical protein HZS_4799 [Henneguya salminicola]